MRDGYQLLRRAITKRDHLLNLETGKDAVMRLTAILEITEQPEEQEHIAHANPLAFKMRLRRTALPEQALARFSEHRIMVAQIIRAKLPAA